MIKITSLTKQQESKLQHYYNKWEQLGKRTSKLDRNKVEQSITYLYSLIDKKTPKVIIVDSPMAVQLTCNVLSKDNQLNNQLHKQLDNQLHKQLDNQLHKQLYNQLDNQLYNQLRKQLYNQLNNQLNNQLDNQLDNQLQKKYFTRSYRNILNYAGYCCYYDFVINELFPDKINNFQHFFKYIEAIRELHYYIMFDDVVIVSEFPEELYYSNNKLHNIDAPAVKYRDSYSLFATEGNPWSDEQVKLYEHNKQFSSVVSNIINS